MPLSRRLPDNKPNLCSYLVQTIVSCFFSRLTDKLCVETVLCIYKDIHYWLSSSRLSSLYICKCENSDEASRRLQSNQVKSITVFYNDSQTETLVRLSRLYLMQNDLDLNDMDNFKLQPVQIANAIRYPH